MLITDVNIVFNLYFSIYTQDSEFTPATDVDVSQPVVTESHNIIHTSCITQLVDTDQGKNNQYWSE